jgi:hypothetical protein
VSSRIRRHSRTTRIRREQLVRSAAGGAGIAIAASLLLNALVTALAQGQHQGGEMPAGLGERLRDAGLTLWGALLSVIRLVSGLPLGLLVTMGLLGAGGGVVYYLVQTGSARLASNGNNTKRRHTKRRRQRTT